MSLADEPRSLGYADSARLTKRCEMPQSPKASFSDRSLQLVGTVLRETLQHRKTYEDLIAFACASCGSLPDEWGFCECITGRDNSVASRYVQQDYRSDRRAGSSMGHGSYKFAGSVAPRGC